MSTNPCPLSKWFKSLSLQPFCFDSFSLYKTRLVPIRKVGKEFGSVTDFFEDLQDNHPPKYDDLPNIILPAKL